ncbi:MAG: hypothetical protein N2167_07425 [Flavobacteriales bacterium]|nr:hypothetical protein [Flavobacteriales bacterium]
MKPTITFALICIVFPLIAQSPKNILILGDSHMMGYFGEFFHRKLHETGKYDILSIGIGGAGSKHYTLRMTNFCCGYKVRLTCCSDKICQQCTIPVFERADVATQKPILRNIGSKLIQVLNFWQPDAVIIALGSNNINAHQELLGILHTFNPKMPYVWVGPFRRMNVAIRYQAIEKGMAAYPNGYLVRSDDIVGHDTLVSAHFTGKTAKTWAFEVVNRLEPFLQKKLFADTLRN